MSTIIVDAGLQPDHAAVRDADLVVVRCPSGTWSVWKDREGHDTRVKCPWDELPTRIKDALRGEL